MFSSGHIRETTIIESVIGCLLAFVFWDVNSLMRQVNFEGDFFGKGAYFILCPLLISPYCIEDLLYSVSNANDWLRVVFVAAEL